MIGYNKLREYRKADLFQILSVLGGKVSKSLTKEEIAKKIIIQYNNDGINNIVGIIGYEAYELLQKIVKGELRIERNMLSAHEVYNLIKKLSILRRYLLVEYDLDFDENVNIKQVEIKITEGIEDSLKELFLNNTKEIEQKYKEYEQYIMAIIKVYGVTSMAELHNQFCYYLGKIVTFKELQEFIDRNAIIISETRRFEIEYIEDKKVVEYICLNDVIDEDQIVYYKLDRTDLEYKKITNKELLDKLKPDIKEKNSIEIYKKLYMDYFNVDKEYFSLKIVEIGSIIDNSAEYMKSLMELDDMDFENEQKTNEYITAFMNAYNDIPQFRLYGYSPSELSKIMYATNNEKVGRNDPCSCGSGKKYKKCCLNIDMIDKTEVQIANDNEQDLKIVKSLQKNSNSFNCINANDVILFYDLWYKLLNYTNRKYNINKKIINLYVGLDIKEITSIREKLWKEKSIIKNYVKENPDNLSVENLNIISLWGKKNITSKFVLMKHTKNDTELVYQDSIYKVKGLSNSLELDFPSSILPKFIDTTLLPFKGCIIYDSIIIEYPISIGPGMKKNFSEEYTDIKNQNKIFTEL